MKMVKLTRLLIFSFILLTIKSHAQISLINIDTLDKVKTYFDSHLNDTSGILFLTGELHGVSSNPESELIFTKFFVNYKNVKTLLIETGYTSAFLINRYLQTGDNSFLDLYVSDYPEKYLEYKNYLLSTKAFYDSLNAISKFTIIGIDIVENDRQPFCHKLVKLLAEKEVYNEDLREQVLALNSKDTFPNNIQSLQNLLVTYKVNLDYSSDVDSILKSYQFWLDNKKNLWKNRDIYLYKKVLSCRAQFSGNIYGHFGYGHIDLKEKCMAYYLNQEGIFKGKLLSIYPYYFNCQSSFFDIRKSEGYNSSYFKYQLTKMKLKKGVYLTKSRGRDYLLHVDYKEMTELK